MNKKKPILEKLRLGSRERIIFTKRLALYLSSGIPIVDALYLLKEGTVRGSQHTLLTILNEDIRRGRLLSESLGQFPRIFTAFHLRLISVGESTGSLAQNLEHLTELLQKRMELARKVMGAASYPLIVLTGALLISGFLILYAFPKIVPLLQGFHTKLPFTTRALINISSFFHVYGLLVGISFAGVGICASLALRQPKCKYWLDAGMLRIPILGSLIQAYQLADLFRLLSLLLKSGIRIDRAFADLQVGLNNSIFRESLRSLEKGVLQGRQVATSMRESPHVFPLTAIQLISAGEMTGTLSESTRMVAELYEERLNELTRTLSSLLEPALMLSMGFIVGFVALAIITPMYSLTQSLSVH